MRIVITRDTVALDALCFDVLGTDAGGVVETALGLNPGLAAELAAQPFLALERTVILPDPETIQPRDLSIKLWD